MVPVVDWCSPGMAMVPVVDWSSPGMAMVLVVEKALLPYGQSAVMSGDFC